MRTRTRCGPQQARAQLPRIVSERNAGVAAVITRHGKPCAAVVPLQDLEALRTHRMPPRALLALRGSGRGLWGADAGKTVGDLRDEWGAA